MEDKQLTEQQLQALLRLKRHEQPPPGYFDGLLANVQRRQREEMLRRPAWRLFFERIGAFFSSPRRDWAYAGTMAGILLIGIGAIQLAMPKRVIVRKQHTPAPEIAAVSAPEGPNKMEVKVKRRVPTNYIIDAQPATYEQQQIRF